jgi:lysophospholipase L1-like esterase
MVAFWLALHTGLLLRQRPAWVPLVVCVGILAVKGSDWEPRLLVLAGLMLVVGLLRLPRFKFHRSLKATPVALILAVGLWVVWIWMSAEWYSSTGGIGQQAVLPGRPISCLGDSLTGFGYPKRLREMISIPVVDEGCNGISAGEAISRLPALLKANPQAVVVELGGHDFLRGRTRAATREHLVRIIEACRSIGAQVILMEIPRGFMIDKYAGLERQLARQYGLVLIPDTAIRRLVLWSPVIPPGAWLPRNAWLSDDGLHPNDRGNQMLAEYVADALARIYGPEVRANKRQ